MNKTIYEIIEEISLNSKFTHTCYSPCLGDCSVALIKDRKKILIHKIGEPSISLELNENGQLHKEGELMLFPDKEKDKSWNAVYKKFIQSKYDVKHLMMVSHNCTTKIVKSLDEISPFLLLVSETTNEHISQGDILMIVSVSCIDLKLINFTKQMYIELTEKKVGIFLLVTMKRN